MTDPDSGEPVPDPVRALIDETITLMTNFELGFPTLDRIVAEEKPRDFVRLDSSAMLNPMWLAGFGEMDGSTASYLSALSDPRAFTGSPARRRARFLTFWSLVRAVQDLSVTFGQYSLNEVARNTGFFGHLASTLRTFNRLCDVDYSTGDDGLIYWADFSSEHKEADLGADFAVIISLEDGLYKVAFLQAKRAKYDGKALISHFVDSRNSFQIDLLLRHEKHHIESKFWKGKPFDETNSSIFNQWCYYLFWPELTDDGQLVLPTVRSANAVKRSMKSGKTNSLDDGIEFATFISLFLADTKSNVGYLVETSQIERLFREVRPKQGMWLNPYPDGPSPEDKAQILSSIGYALASPSSGKIARMKDPGDSDEPSGPSPI